jgi:hypothetical protein
VARYKYTPQLLAEAATESHSVAEVLRRLGIRWNGGAHAHISRQLKRLGIDTGHFTGSAHNRGAVGANRRTAEQLLVRLPVGSRRTPGFRLARALRQRGVPDRCTTAQRRTVIAYALAHPDEGYRAIAAGLRTAPGGSVIVGHGRIRALLVAAGLNTPAARRDAARRDGAQGDMAEPDS